MIHSYLADNRIQVTQAMPQSRSRSQTWLWGNGRSVRLVSTASAFKLQLFLGTARRDEMKVPKDVEKRVQASINWLSSEDDPFDPYKLALTASSTCSLVEFFQRQHRTVRLLCMLLILLAFDPILALLHR